MDDVLDNDIIMRELELQTLPFGLILHGKDITPLILTGYRLNSTATVLLKDDFDIK